jgi:cell wall-associated NlpC family hydrolase
MKRAVRGAVSITAVIMVVSFSPVPALAQPPQPPPPPSTASEALKLYQELSEQASKANEDLLVAKDDLAKKQAELDKATADLAAAQQSEAAAKEQEEQFRGTVDALANASFQGARFSNLSALLSGGSQEDFLQRASALSVLAAQNKEALDKFTSAVDQAADARNKATDAQRRSQEAKDAAAQLTDQVTKTKTDLDARAREAERAYARLSGRDRQQLLGPEDKTVYLAPPGAARAAVQKALDQVGKPYVYGAEGPNSFDCSGLTSFAYKAAGVTLPRTSRAQYTVGKPVAHGQWIAGDLLFYGSSPSTIHHVAMHIGNGKLVHASTSGVPVQVRDAPYGGGRNYLGAKRIVG